MIQYPLSINVQSILDNSRIDGIYKSAFSFINYPGEVPDCEKESKRILIEFIKKELENVSAPILLEKSVAAKKQNIEKNARKNTENGLLDGQGRTILRIENENWLNDADLDRNFQYKKQSWLIIQPCLFADFESRNYKWYYPCIAYVMGWINSYVIGQNVTDFGWYDMAVGQRASRLSYLLRRALDEGDEDCIAPMIVTSHIHMMELMERKKIALHSNHGLFQMAGLLSLGRNLPFLSLSKQAIDFSTELIQDMLNEHFGSDGLHKEHSPGYHIFMTNYISSLLESGFMEKSKYFNDLAIKSIEAANWLCQPDQSILPFGDTIPINIQDKASFNLNRIRNNPSCPEGLMFFDKGGIVIHSKYNKLNEPSNYFAFNGSFHSRQHKHADDLSIQLFSKGKGIFTDAGSYTYQYNLPERMYVESTRAHNCLEIDGLNYSRFNSDVFGNAIDYVEEIGNCIFIDSTINRRRLYPSDIPNNKVSNNESVPVKIKHNRVVIYHPEEFIVVIDSMESDRQHNYTQWFHLFPDLKIKSKKENVQIINADDEFVAAVTPINVSSVNIDIVQGQLKPRLEGWISSNGNSLVETNSIKINTFGKNQVIATLIDLKENKSSFVDLNSGSEGRYLRLVIEKYKSRFEFILRRKDNHIDYTYIENEHLIQKIVKPNGDVEQFIKVHKYKKKPFLTRIKRFFQN